MKNSLTKALIGAVAAGVTTLCVSVASWSMGHGEGPPDPAAMVTHMTAKLDLTEEQQGKVEALLAATSEQAGADRVRLRQLREEMRGQRDNFDAGVARKIADEFGEISGRMMYQIASTQAGIYQLLTDEQKAKMDILMEKRESRREEWRGKGRKNRE